jgi:Mg-chelatase subunit ChlD
VQLSLERPEWLVLLAAGVPVVWLAWRSSPVVGRVRAIAAASLRLLVILLLATGLSRPSLVHRGEGVSLVVVGDASRSMPTAPLAEAQAWIQATLERSRLATDRTGVVTLAREPQIQSLPSAGGRADLLRHAGDASASDLAAGIRTALAVLPADTRNRILLVSDGLDTAGSLGEAVEQAAAAGVPIDVLPVMAPRSSDVMVEAVRTPARARRGQVMDARVVLRSTGPAEGQLVMKVDGRGVDLDPSGPGTGLRVRLEGGPAAFNVPLPVDRPGAVRVEATFEPESPDRDAVPENNRGESITFVGDEGRVLVVRQGEEPVDAILRALAASRLEAEVIDVSLLPRRLAAGDFDACILANVPRWALDAEADRGLRSSVHDMGCGLLMLGGDRSFGAGGWQDSETAKTIPVEMNPPQERRLPSGALAIIIDASGSMSMPVAGANASQQQIAAEAAIKAIRALSPRDEVTVIAFSGDATVVVPLTTCDSVATIEQRVRSIESGGGTNMFPALRAASEQLAGASARTRHAIVLSDGQTMGDPGEGLAIAAEMARSGQTLSTVAIGDAANDGLLARLARVADGRFYEVRDDQSRVSIPQIFIKEAQLIRRSLLWEGEPFTPAQATRAEWLPSGGVPPIRGYVVTGVRGDPAVTGWFSPTDPPDPLLAWWNHGLGRGAAFTSDLGGRWTPAWAAWPGFQPFVGGLVRWLLRPSAPGDVAIRTELEGDRARVEVEVTGDSAARAERAEVRVMHPDGSSSSVMLRQVGPGRWTGGFGVDERGAYLMNAAVGLSGSARPLFTQASISVPYPREFRRVGADMAALERVAARTGGRLLKVGDPDVRLHEAGSLRVPEALRQAWDICLVAAAMLFLMDVAARRLALGWGDRQGPVRRDTDRVAEAWRAARRRARGPVPQPAMANGPETSDPIPMDTPETRPGSATQRVEPPALQPPSVSEAPRDDTPMGRLRAAKRRARQGDGA